MTTISPHGIGQGNYHPSDTVVTAAPPPAEVKVRTMRSDLESMAKSGGGLPRFQNVKVAKLSSQVAPGQSAAVSNAPSKSIITIILVLVGLAVIGLAGWFGYSYFIAHRSATSTPQAPASSSSNQSQSNAALAPTTTAAVASPPAQVPTSAATSTVAETNFTHSSAFKIPADQVLTISFSSAAAASAADLQSYSQKIASLVATAKPTATFLEIDAKNAQGNDASIADLFSEANASVFAPTTLGIDFKPDATFFVYRDKNGSWPGYVMRAMAGVSANTLQSDAQSNIESSAGIPNLFLTDPGTPSPEGFSSSTIAGLPVRILSFTGGTVPSTFVYGWVNNDEYLVLSTSQNGYAVALKRLGY